MTLSSCAYALQASASMVSAPEAIAEHLGRKRARALEEDTLAGSAFCLGPLLKEDEVLPLLPKRSHVRLSQGLACVYSDFIASLIAQLFILRVTEGLQEVVLCWYCMPQRP